MLEESDRAPILSADLLRRLNALNEKKCGQEKEKACFLSELDAGLSAQSDRYLLFRGEPDGFETPMTSALLRGAVSGNSLCQKSCDTPTLTKHTHALVDQLIHKVAKENPRFYGGHTFNVTTQDWQMEEMASNPLFEDKRKPSAFELLINAHFRGHLQTLKLRDSNSDVIALDPFVSFSSSPEVAAKFSQSYVGRGRIWMISFRESDLMRIEGGKCRAELKRVGLYDLSRCSRPRIYKGEREYDAYLHAPSNSILGFFRR